MLKTLVRKIVGTRNEREIKRMQPVVAEINELGRGLGALSDEELRRKTVEFRERLDNGQDLDDLLPEAFAVVREASGRVLGMRHFDVQMMGGMVLHSGKIAEMKTGEGKTLVATLPVYLNALEGKGVHVVTVNDYLARRDAEWMGRLYRFLGLSVGVILHGLDDRQRQEAYNADVTYGQNNEFGFDYLRDNMKFALEDYVHRTFPKEVQDAKGKTIQKLFNYAIVDEVDSILIDEARTPLIISGPAEESTEKYYVIDRVIPRLQKEADFTVDEKTRNAILTEEGIAKVEKALGVANLYDPGEIDTLHHVNQALRAHAIYKRDVDYVVKDGEVMIVDEFTGRLMPGRRWSDGLHQAVEAKENVRIERENQTLATITFQNYFRMYDKLAGMTGTADTEATEFHQIYDLEVLVVPTHRPMIRSDLTDVVYKTEREKFDAVIEDIRERHDRGQPILVGTISIEKSEHVSSLLKKAGIKHHVLNAKQHEREAEFVAQAGRLGALTISTNMAGRGTDIVLGGNAEFMAAHESGTREPEDPAFQAALEKYKAQCAAEREQVLAAGGLHILGTERHESRRIDNQLRGRSGRQGDPGSSRFFLSLEDDLLRIFGAERVQKIMERLGMEEGEPIEHRWINAAIENAQKKVEAHNFDIRKHLLEYDDVMNKQREVIYARRREVLSAASLKDEVLDTAEELADGLVATQLAKDESPEEWDWKALDDVLFRQFSLRLNLSEREREGLSTEDAQQLVVDRVRALYEEKERTFTEPVMRHLEKVIMLQAIDTLWKDHLLAMDHLKEGIGLRGYGQKNPLQEYQKEGFDMFQDLMNRLDADIVEKLFTVQLAREEDVERMEQRQQQRQAKMAMTHGGEPAAARPEVIKRDAPKVGRNDPCVCGSGKKYKKCCGAAH
ncbi:MAG: preprotein translocase subunit SecA [Polyangiaceae bacterium UTPRO1]|nr:MAG: preprotein translocase subunit SecA [Polyangiaceae bacterium UTPRO1]